MSKKRLITRYSIAAALTGIYAAAVVEKYANPEMRPEVTKERLALVSGSMAALTWLVAVL